MAQGASCPRNTATCLTASPPSLPCAPPPCARPEESGPSRAPRAFLANLEKEVLRLERELRSGCYQPGRYKTIEVRDPKHRVVSAAPFRDRVVHHAFCAVCEPIFERGFIYDSYANRRGKGTHRAVARYEAFRDRFRAVLRCDVYRYFPAIDHQILKDDLRRRIACPRTLALADRIVDGSNPQEPIDLYFPGDDLFTPFERRRGLPIGNLTSQFFANLYLDGLDHFCKEVLRAEAVICATSTISRCSTTTPDACRDGESTSPATCRADGCCCIRTRPGSPRRRSRPRFWASSCCPAVIGVCRKTTCAAFAIAFAGCARDGGTDG